MQTFDINTFQANALQNGLLSSNFFLAVLSQPQCMQGDTRFLTYLCTAATLPGIQIVSADERFTGYAKAQKIPFDVVHTDISLTFLSDGAGQSVGYFDQWIRSVVAFGAPGANIKGAARGDAQYPEVYQTTLELYQYNEMQGSGDEVLKYTMYEAYPYSMSEQAVDWAADSALCSRSVQFAFRDFDLQVNSFSSLSGGMVNNPSYLQDSYVGSFLSAWSARQAVLDAPESVFSAVIGEVGLSSVLSAVSGIAAGINSALSGSVADASASFPTADLPVIID